MGEIGRRCAIGCEDWPDKPEYAVCAICGERTTRTRNLSPLPEDEARSKVAHLKFEEYYEQHCAEHAQPVEGDIT